MSHKHTHIGYILLILILAGTAFYFYSTEYKTTKTQLGSTAEQLTSVQAQSEQMKEFFKKYSESVTLIESSYLSAKVGDTNYESAEEYNSLINSLYEIYNINDGYDYEYHSEFYDSAIEYYKDGLKKITKAKKNLEELQGKEPNDFWKKEITLRLEQARLSQELYEADLDLVEGRKEYFRLFSEVGDENLATKQYNKVNDILIPKENIIVKDFNKNRLEINTHWGVDFYEI